MATETAWSRSMTLDSQRFEPKSKIKSKKSKKKKQPETKADCETTENESNVNESVETQALHRLKLELQPLINTKYGPYMDMSESTLLRWLRETNYNYLYAAAKIQKHERLKLKLGLVNITVNYKPCKFLDDYYSGGLCGEDKEGSPIYYELFGVLDIKGIILSVKKQELLSFKMYQLELMKEYLKVLSKEKGKQINNILIIVDMMRCSRDCLWGPALRIWAEIAEILQDNYPQLAKEIIVIHPPPMYAEIYLALRPYLRPSTLKLIKVLGHNFFKYLEERIHKHHIPAYLGGYKCDYDNNPSCFEDLNWVELVPQWLYLTSPSSQARAQEFNILAGERHVEEYLVTLKNSVLSWEFYFIGHPVVVAFYLDGIKHRSCVFRKENMTTASKKRNHAITCESSGRYFLVLDNCKDHSHSVRVLCNIAVSPPAAIPLSHHNVPLGDTINFRERMTHEEQKMKDRIKLHLPPIAPSNRSSIA